MDEINDTPESQEEKLPSAAVEAFKRTFHIDLNELPNQAAFVGGGGGIAGALDAASQTGSFPRGFTLWVTALCGAKFTKAATERYRQNLADVQAERGEEPEIDGQEVKLSASEAAEIDESLAQFENHDFSDVREAARRTINPHNIDIAAKATFVAGGAMTSGLFESVIQQGSFLRALAVWTGTLAGGKLAGKVAEEYKTNLDDVREEHAAIREDESTSEAHQPEDYETIPELSDIVPPIRHVKNAASRAGNAVRDKALKTGVNVQNVAAVGGGGLGMALTTAATQGSLGKTAVATAVGAVGGKAAQKVNDIRRNRKERREEAETFTERVGPSRDGERSFVDDEAARDQQRESDQGPDAPSR